MNKLILTLSTLAVLASSALADFDGCSYDEYIRQQREIQNEIDDINSRLDFEAQQDFIRDNWNVLGR